MTTFRSNLAEWRGRRMSMSSDPDTEPTDDLQPADLGSSAEGRVQHARRAGAVARKQATGQIVEMGPEQPH